MRRRNMKRVIIAGTIAFLIVIIFSTMFTQDSLLQAFASSDILHQIVRVGMIGLLITLLLTAQPRSTRLRAILGGASVFLTIGAVSLLTEYFIGILDALLFIEVAVIFAIEALESPEMVKNLEKNTSEVRVSKTKQVTA